MHWTRRQVIATAGAATGMGIAGCLSEDGENDTVDPDTYPKRDVKWMVPYSTGGGFDSYSRLAAELMPEHLPGDGDIVVENITGAGGRRGTNSIYQAEPNGNTLGILNIPGLVVAQTLMDVDFDLNDISWIGNFHQTNYGILVDADSEYETLENLQEADKISWGATGPSATSSMVTFIASEELGINSEFVHGYEGGEEVRAGILRGEVDARMNDYPAARPLVEDGEMRYIIVLDTEPPEWASNVPTVVDEGYDALADLSLNFTAVAPPGMDDEQIGRAHV